jgi:hypothetical protein
MNTNETKARLAADPEDFRPGHVARIRKPQVAHQPFSRTAAEAAAEDGIDLSVTVRKAS